MSARVVLCATGDGCTCGAPASTPAGMHHCDCAVHPGWCGQAWCLPCEKNGKTGETERCAICAASILPPDGGLCDDHKYDEQTEESA